MSSDVTITKGPETSQDAIRIYICEDCKQFIPIAAHTGPYKYDYLLHKVESEHGGPRTETEARDYIKGWQGLPPLGRGHATAVVSVTKAAWEDEARGRPKIVAQIKETMKGGPTGFSADFYAVKDQFKEDAMSCWKAHNKTHNCDDFKTDKMRLEPDTKSMRRSEGLGNYRSDIHLCNFCPVGSLVEQALRKNKVDKGLY